MSGVKSGRVLLLHNQIWYCTVLSAASTGCISMEAPGKGERGGAVETRGPNFIRFLYSFVCASLNSARVWRHLWRCPWKRNLERRRGRRGRDFGRSDHECNARFLLLHLPLSLSLALPVGGDIFCAKKEDALRKKKRKKKMPSQYGTRCSLFSSLSLSFSLSLLLFPLGQSSHPNSTFLMLHKKTSSIFSPFCMNVVHGFAKIKREHTQRSQLTLTLQFFFLQSTLKKNQWFFCS